VDVVLTNMCNTTFHSGTFLLPSMEPVNDLSTYRAVYNELAGYYAVVTRETGQHNYKAMTVPYMRSLLDVEQTEVTAADPSEPCHTSTTSSVPGVTVEEEVATGVPLPALTQVMTPQIVPDYYSSPTGDDWAILDEEEQTPSEGTGAQCSESINSVDNISPKIASSPTESASTYFQGIAPGNAELQNAGYGELSHGILALDLGLPVKRATNAWSKGTCVQSLDLQIRDINTTTLAEWILDDVLPSSEWINLNDRSGSTASSESSVTDRGEASTGHQIPMREENNVQFKLPNLRQHIPKDTSQDVQLVLQHSVGVFKTEWRSLQWAQGKVDWFYMMQASTRLLASGKSQRRPLFEETGRSVGRTAHPRTIASRPAETKTRRVHHYNFNAKPVYCKSSTPPAVSYWVTSSPALKEWNDYTGSLHQIVVSSQAAKYVDPYLYHGPQIDGVLEGTTLREHVTGHVEKVYSSHGTWSEDKLDVDDDRPVDGGETPRCMHSCCVGLNTLPRPYEISAADGDVVLNDDGRRHPPALSTDRQVVGRPSRLSFTENASDLEEEPKSETPSGMLPNTVSVGEEACPGLVQQEALSDEEDATEQPEADDAVRSSTVDSCPRVAAWLEKIHHLSSLPIEEKTAYLYEAWSPPSKTCSQNRLDLTKWSEQPESHYSRNQDLAKWSEEPESSSKRYQDLTKWSEEPEKLGHQYQDPGVFLPGEISDEVNSYPSITEPDGNQGSDTAETFVGKSLASLSRDESRHGLHPQNMVHITDKIETYDKDNLRCDSGVSTRNKIDQSKNSCHNDSGLSFDSGKDILSIVLKDSRDMLDLRSKADNLTDELQSEESLRASMELMINSPNIDLEVKPACEAAHCTLGAGPHDVTISLIDDSNFLVDREPEDDCIAIQEIDKCLDDIKELMSPLQFDTTKRSPFQRPKTALGSHLELSVNHEWTSEPEPSNISLKLSDIIYDEWSTSSEDDSSGTKDKQVQADDSSASNDGISVGGVSPQLVQEVLVFSQIHVICDAPGTPETNCIGLDVVSEQENSTGVDFHGEVISANIEVNGESGHVLAFGERTSQSPEPRQSESLPTKNEDIVDTTTGSVSTSPATTSPEDLKDIRECLGSRPPTVSEGEIQANTIKLNAEALRYLDTATQTEELVFGDEVELPAEPSPTHFDCSSLFNLSIPKISFTDCLVYGGAALYLGHQAYRAFRR